ncbi:hypothetical protein [Sutcliffiella rhizosphaerae]|uniref:Uncharacterized protein n=1 Tax=Sutcliffiella rhizosphaerae TaxID=2880967 RepID=A0ABN8AGS0_9BACI|nr:hypothetical protein [Sutcliffiella rhizosphaerae]CAG9622672.1 hypothetical protein BACCIP111883_03463 [Sutcliffiella rhizosphaerae]
MQTYVKDSLLEWKDEMLNHKKEIDEEYDRVKNDLKLYSIKFSITKQVMQSTINDEIINTIKSSYHRPYEEKFQELKQYMKELDEKRKVFQMFIEKIEKASETEIESK